MVAKKPAARKMALPRVPGPFTGGPAGLPWSSDAFIYSYCPPDARFSSSSFPLSDVSTLTQLARIRRRPLVAASSAFLGLGFSFRTGRRLRRLLGSQWMPGDLEAVGATSSRSASVSILVPRSTESRCAKAADAAHENTIAVPASAKKRFMTISCCLSFKRRSRVADRFAHPCSDARVRSMSALRK